MKDKLTPTAPIDESTQPQQTETAWGSSPTEHPEFSANERPQTKENENV
jgi:hypothetical protein